MRSESPGVAEKLKRWIVDVEIEVVDARCCICTASTMRNVASMPSVAEILDERHVVRLERRLVEQELDA